MSITIGRVTDFSADGAPKAAGATIAAAVGEPARPTAKVTKLIVP